MSLPNPSRFAVLTLQPIDRWLQRRWVQGALFVGSLVAFWVLSSGVAHAG